MSDICTVFVKGIVVFTGEFTECKKYITDNFTIAEFNKDYIDIVHEAGRLASYVLKW